MNQTALYSKIIFAQMVKGDIKSICRKSSQSATNQNSNKHSCWPNNFETIQLFFFLPNLITHEHRIFIEWFHFDEFLVFCCFFIFGVQYEYKSSNPALQNIFDWRGIVFQAFNDCEHSRAIINVKAWSNLRPIQAILSNLLQPLETESVKRIELFTQVALNSLSSWAVSAKFWAPTFLKQ